MKTIDKAKIIASTSNDTKKQSIYDIAINSLHGNLSLYMNLKERKYFLSMLLPNADLQNNIKTFKL